MVGYCYESDLYACWLSTKFNEVHIEPQEQCICIMCESMLVHVSMCVCVCVCVYTVRLEGQWSNYTRGQTIRFQSDY